MSETPGKPPGSTQGSHGIPRRAEAGPAPLSFGQQRLWFLDQLRPNTPLYNMTQVLRLTGRLEFAALERALNEIRRRHDVLRASFAVLDDQPAQIVSPFQPLPLTLVDRSNLPEGERERACGQAIEECSRQPFNLERDRLMRTALVRVGITDHRLVVVTHHIVSDGWSRRLFTQECASLYEAFSQGQPSPLPELPIQYSDYTRWQREWFRGAVLDRQLSYWKSYLAGAQPVLELPTDRPRADGQPSAGACISMVLPAELVQSLKLVSQRHAATLFMALLAAFEILLHRMSGQEDIVLGTPIAGRTQLETEELMGFFVNTLAIRADLSGNPTFEGLLTRARAAMLEAINHQELPFEKLVEELQPERSLAHTPLFRVMLNVFLLDDPEVRTPGLTIEDVSPRADDSKFDLTLYVLKERQDLRVDLKYNSGLFETARMEEMLDQFFSLLRQIAAAPDKRIGSYSMVTDRARRLLPDPTVVLPEPYFGTVVSEFLRRAGQSPTHTAVSQTGRSWTYQELSSASHAIARALAARGMERRDVVAVTGTRSFGLIASVVGVFMGGGVLLTIDRSLPPLRQRIILKEGQARHLVYVGEWRAEDGWLLEIPGLEIIRVSTQAEAWERTSAPSLPDASPDDPAYIFFTSGTTGTPKGVRGCQKGLSQFLAWQRTTFDVGPQDRCAQLTSLSFEVVLRDIFLPLVSGATLCLPDAAADTASDLTLQWMDREAITLFHAVPTLAQAWLGATATHVVPHGLRWAFFGGEPLTDVLVRRWRKVMPRTGRIVNFYGPAETTLAKCFHVVPDEPARGIQLLGKPLPCAQALVLNGNQQLCGVGEPGEIVIRTPFRTLGYVNAPEEQLKRFVRNPFRDDAADLVYLTGDRGRYRADGALEFLGRADDQVKIRGVRVEPAEVTAILCRHPAVNACFVTAVEDSEGENALVAYVVPTAANVPGAGALRSYLGDQLPSVMVPSAFVFLDALPMTPNGKIDRRALARPDLTKARAPHGTTPPRTPTEQVLERIWCRVLKREQVGVEDNFFDLGGHSLIATQVVAHVRREFDVEIPLNTIFAKPTIEALALYVLEQKVMASNTADIGELLAEVESLSDENAANQSRLFEREGPSGLSETDESEPATPDVPLRDRRK